MWNPQGEPPENVFHLGGKKKLWRNSTGQLTCVEENGQITFRIETEETSQSVGLVDLPGSTSMCVNQFQLQDCWSQFLVHALV